MHNRNLNFLDVIEHTHTHATGTHTCDAHRGLLHNSETRLQQGGAVSPISMEFFWGGQKNCRSISALFLFITVFRTLPPFSESLITPLSVITDVFSVQISSHLTNIQPGYEQALHCEHWSGEWGQREEGRDVTDSGKEGWHAMEIKSSFSFARPILHSTSLSLAPLSVSVSIVFDVLSINVHNSGIYAECALWIVFNLI